jgi:hypothetical protein
MQQSVDQMTTQPHPEPGVQQTERLPCRGCTRQCEYYSRCNGAPWRMDLPPAGGEVGGAP